MTYAEGPELRPEFLRFGVELTDGRKATNVSDRQSLWRALHESKSTPEGPVLSQRGGRGSGDEFAFEYWLWPLPPPGRLTFVCEWPVVNIALTRTEIDAALVLEAATHSTILWGDAEETHSSSFGIVITRAEEQSEQ